MGHRPRRGKSRHIRDGRMRAQIQEHPFASELTGPSINQFHRDGSLADETCLPHDELNASGFEPLDMEPTQTIDHRTLPGRTAQRR